MPTPPTIFGTDIAGLIGGGLGALLLPATLTKLSPTSYDAANPGGGLRKTAVTYGCRAVVTKHQESLIKSENTRVQNGEIMVLLSTVVGHMQPTEGDRITMTWPDGVTRIAYVKAVSIDPAGAQATCKVTA